MILEQEQIIEPQRQIKIIKGKRMKVGLFTWQPGLLGVSKSSAGGEGYTRFIIDVLNYQGYVVAWLPGGDKIPIGTVRVDDPGLLDVAVFFWRWEMPDYPERNELYKEQMRLLHDLHDKGVPIIVHDQDHKISAKDLKLLKSFNVMLTAPELNVRPGFRTLHYPSPWIYRKVFPFVDGYGLLHLEIWNRIPFMATTALAYVGNMYERYDQAKDFLNPISEAREVKVWGNWIEDGPNRPGEKAVRAEFPKVDFRGRLAMSAVVENLAQANTTIHLSKPSYAKHGFLAWRWIEVAASKTPAFIPDNFWLPKGYKAEFRRLGFIVKDGEDLAKRYDEIKDSAWEEMVELQQYFVEEHCDIWRWLDLINEAQETKK